MSIWIPLVGLSLSLIVSIFLLVILHRLNAEAKQLEKEITAFERKYPSSKKFEKNPTENKEVTP